MLAAISPRVLLLARASAAAPPGHLRRASSVASAVATPRAAALLGGAGLVPFVWYAAQHEPESSARAVPRGDALLSRIDGGSGWLVAALGAGDQRGVRRAFAAYGGVILSFLGAVHWGLAMVATPPAPARRFAASVLPSLLGWAAVRAVDAQDARLRERAPALLLAGGLLAVYAYDEAAARARRVPGWYTFLRTPLTLVAVGSCLAASRLGAEPPPDDGSAPLIRRGAGAGAAA